MATNTLTDAACRRATYKGKPEKLSDGGGLFLHVRSETGKFWRMAYRFGGKQQLATFGPYPQVGLAEARRLRDELKSQLRQGLDPREKEGAGPQALTFKQACIDYFAERQDLTTGYKNEALRALERNLWPVLGDEDLQLITRSTLLAELMHLNDAKAFAQVRKVKMWAGSVFDWAIERGHTDANPAATIRSHRAFGKRLTVSYAALELGEVHEFWARLGQEGELQSVLACKFLALTWVRTKELRCMRWENVDGDLWRVPAEVMKMRRDHLVPLSSQALNVLKILSDRRIGEYVFPSSHRGVATISENYISDVIKRLGYNGRMTGHGWRSVGSTWANENGFSADAIEMQLAHVPANKVRSIYNRAEYLDQRRTMLQAWADWLTRD